MGPSTSMMRPSAGRLGVGQRVSSATTIAPGSAFRASAGGTCTSVSSRLSNGTTKPRPESSRSKRPTTEAFARSRIRMTRPSMRSACCRSMRTTTRSPWSASLRLADETYTSGDASRPVSGVTNPKPARMRLQAADDEVHPVGEAEPVAANLDQVAALDERLQVPAHGRAVLARDAQQLQQLLGGRGMLDALADLGEQLFA